MRIYLAMPLYSRQVDKGAAAGYWNPLMPGSPHTVYRPMPGSESQEPCSILPYGFNRCWAEAWNLYAKGQIDCYAQIHGDVSPEWGWLDVLERERWLAGVDVISTVLPLKGQSGLTSTAVEIGQEWLMRRLSTYEVHRTLPKTFTEAFGKPLLLNTGLWLCKIGDWCDKVGFEFKTPIAIDTGRPRLIQGDAVEARFPLVLGEDIGFSRQCHGFGVKLAATSLVVADHMDGNTAYSNQEVWGMKTEKGFEDACS